MLETPFPSFISKKLGEIPIFGTFLAKKSILAYISLKIGILRLAMFENVIMMSYVGINGKGRPSPVLWYHIIILWPCLFQVHGGGNPGVVTTPLRKMCYRKYLRKTRVNPFENHTPSVKDLVDSCIEICIFMLIKWGTMYPFKCLKKFIQMRFFFKQLMLD